MRLYELKAKTMNKKVLKNSKGQYFTITATKDHTGTYDLDKATIFEASRAAQIAQAYNRDHDGNMVPVSYDKEVLAYYPNCIYHADNEADAKRYAFSVLKGEADGQYSKAKATCLQGLWFVYARKEGVLA